MKQVSNSLLTINLIPFTANVSVPAVPRVKNGMNARRFTPFNSYWKNGSQGCSALPGLSCLPRSFVRSWLGEGRIRSLLHKIGSALVAVSATVILIQSASGADGLVVNLKEAALVQSATILLKDVADLRGPDSNQIEKLLQITLGSSPEFGSVKILTRHQIEQCIEAAVGPLRSDAFSGAAAIHVRVKGKAVNPEDIAALLKAYLRKTASWKDSEIEIRSVGNLNGIELPPGNAELRLSSAAPLMSYKSIHAPIEIVLAGKTLRCFWITAAVAVNAEILVAAKRISLGKIVQAGDVEIKAVAIADLRGAYARSFEDVVGKAAGRIYSPGDPVRCESFTVPSLVKSGEIIQLRLEREGIALTSQARAIEDGSLGQVIRVRNVEFSSIVKAQVTGRSQVTLQ
jgi:flagellar basal body P-ring formation protein FlgA